MRVGKVESSGQLVHLAEGHFSLTGRGRYMLSTLKHLEIQGQCAPRVHLSPQQLRTAENGVSSDQAGVESKVAPSAARDKTVVATTNTVFWISQDVV